MRFPRLFNTIQRDAEVLRRVQELEERLEKAERSLANAQLDWDDLYEKMRRLYGRIAKRQGEAPDASPGPDPRNLSLFPTVAEIRARTGARSR